MRVQFTKDFSYRPSGERRVTIKYRADGGPAGDGDYGHVRREAGEAAIAAGAAHEIKASKKDDAESE